MDDIESFNMPIPGSRRRPDFNQPIEVAPESLHAAHLYFSWGQQTVGFGQCSISLAPDGSVSAGTEGMGKEWLRRALYAAVDALVEQAKLG